MGSGTHTSTGEWQSFETRMRRRRAERLAIRAEAAAAAGLLDEARTCFDEAKALAPALPQLALVEQKLSVPAAAARRPRARLFWVGSFAAAAILLIAVPAWLAMTPDAGPRRPAVLESSAPALGSAVSALPAGSSATSPSPSPATTPPEPAPAAVFASETSAAADAIDRATIPPAPAVPVLSNAQPARPIQDPSSTASTGIQQDPPARSAEPPLPRVSAPRIEDPPPPPAIPTTEAAPLSNAARVGTTETPVAPPPVSAPPASELPRPDVPPENAVRTVLNRYASAYSALDVDAAERVWPGVNRSALSRAFDSLASQQISLGDCQIDLAGSSATARCAGTATWTPKVGDGGTHRESRRWTFELTRAGEGWAIVSTRVQNR